MWTERGHVRDGEQSWRSVLWAKSRYPFLGGYIKVRFRVGRSASDDTPRGMMLPSHASC